MQVLVQGHEYAVRVWLAMRKQVVQHTGRARWQDLGGIGLAVTASLACQALEVARVLCGWLGGQASGQAHGSAALDATYLRSTLISLPPSPSLFPSPSLPFPCLVGHKTC